MFASSLADFFKDVAAFQADVAPLTQALERDKKDALAHLPELDRAIGALLGRIRDLEARLSGAQDLIRDIKQIFRRLVTGFFSRGRYFDRALKKPRGYAGDYRMLEMIYTQEMAADGLERLLDAYVLDLPMAKAAVDRKEFVREWLAQRLTAHPSAKVVDVGCGSCRVERELLERIKAPKARFVMVDHDDEALDYSRSKLNGHARQFEFVKENALNLARGHGNKAALEGAQCIVCLGLFDYLPHNIAVRLIRLFRQSVVPGGEILIGNYDLENPNETLMDWTVDWPLILRGSHDFFELFIEAGFDRKQVKIEREKEKGLILMLTGSVPP